MRLTPDKVVTIVIACCTLHNFLRSKQTSRNVYTPTGSVDIEDTDTHTILNGDWRARQEHGRLLPMETFNNDYNYILLYIYI